MKCYDSPILKNQPDIVTNRETHLDKLAIIPRNEHKISRKSISEAALKVLYRLDKSGFRACLVGGGVRDLLLDKKPKDFDIATDATPEQVRELFRNSRIIGRRFRLVHIRFGREIIEVATFRGHSEESPKTELNTEGRILRDNTFGEIEEDAIRRDFTVNALYYDINDFSVLDYAHGLKDIENRTMRMIGDATTRYQEDPVRMLRAIRFAAKLDFEIEEQAANAIFECAPLLANIPAARLFDEIVKLFHSGNACRVLELLRHYQLLEYLVPALDEWMKNEPDESMLDFIDQALVNTDIRINSEHHVSPAFIFAVLLWPVVHKQANKLQAEKMKAIPALNEAGSEIFSRQIKHIAIPRRYTQMSKDIWSMQPRFQRTQGKYPERLIDFPNFRAAYDFMCIQSMVGLMPKQLCQWWTDFQVEHKPAESTHRGPARARARQRGRRRHAS
jgi:poly(A) polymerase